LPEDWQAGGFGLYVHWPFCASKCPYCDFNSHVSAEIDFEAWEQAFLAELDRVGNETSGRVLNSLYFGGGTPSLMPEAIVAGVIDALPKHWKVANDIEITLEANPTSVEERRFAGYRAAGVNRISLGVQALDDQALRQLGRLHDVRQALSALDVARMHFDRVNFDLIYARQDQSLDSWVDELQRALAFAPRHLSLYQLTIEDGTAFGERFQRGLLRGLPDEDLAADMFFATQEICEAAGLPAYEVSNHAVPGEESRHNLIYWRGGDYAAVGPGAHGRLTLGGARYAVETEPDPAVWLDRVRSKGNGEAGRKSLSRSDQASELLMMGLRTRDGVDLQRFEALRGRPVERQALVDMTELGLVEVKGETLAATMRGRAVLNQLIVSLLPD